MLGAVVWFSRVPCAEIQLLPSASTGLMLPSFSPVLVHGRVATFRTRGLQVHAVVQRHQD